MVGRLGFEPRTNDLKGRCSTIELSTRNKRVGENGFLRRGFARNFSPANCAEPLTASNYVVSTGVWSSDRGNNSKLYSSERGRTYVRQSAGSCLRSSAC